VRLATRLSQPQVALDDSTADQELRFHDGGVLCLCYHNDRLFTGAQDGIIAAWDLTTFQVCAKLQGHQAGVLSLVAHQEQLFRYVSSIVSPEHYALPTLDAVF
jgi:WD40 repeat protein